MKLCSIGNSFSQDAHKWLSKLAAANGVQLETANLYIGGCSLATHWKNATEDAPNYDWELNGNPGTRKIRIAEALETEQWDVITLQQVSGLSGVWESYEPYLSSLAETVRKAQPNAKLYFHQTWAYEIGSDHPDFGKYDSDRDKMFRCIQTAGQNAARLIGADLIPTGTVIQTLRKTVPAFDVEHGGLSLCRDGYHLSLNYGRYAAAATWLRTLTGCKIALTPFEDFSPEYLREILAVVNAL